MTSMTGWNRCWTVCTVARSTWLCWALAVGITVAASAGVARAQDCRQTIVKHGYLSQAQFECDFDYYNEDAIIDAANACGVDKDATGQLLKQGMESAIVERGKAENAAGWCASVLKRFPSDVRP